MGGCLTFFTSRITCNNNHRNLINYNIYLVVMLAHIDAADSLHGLLFYPAFITKSLSFASLVLSMNRIFFNH